MILFVIMIGLWGVALSFYVQTGSNWLVRNERPINIDTSPIIIFVSYFTIFFFNFNISFSIHQQNREKKTEIA